MFFRPLNSLVRKSHLLPLHKEINIFLASDYSPAEAGFEPLLA